MNINRTKKLSSVIFILLFACLFIIWGTYWSKWGIDLTDSGFFLYSQSRLINQKMESITPTFLWIGSDWIGSFWLSLTDQSSLHFARIGSFVLYGLIFIFVYFSLLELTLDVKYSILITLSSYILFGSLNIFPLIDYDSAPLLFVTILFYLITKYFKSSNKNFILFLIGIVTFYLLISRVTLIILICSYLTLIFFLFKKISLKNIVCFFSGVLFLLSILLIFSFTRKSLFLTFETLKTSLEMVFSKHKIISSLSLFNSHNYSLFDQLYFWIRGYFRFGMIITLFYFILLLFRLNKNETIKKIIYVVLVTILITFVLFPINEKNPFLEKLLNIQSQIINFYFLPSMLFVIFYLSYKHQKENKFLILFLFFTFLFYSLGSNSFEKKITLTFPLIVPILLTFFLNIDFKEKFFVKDEIKVFFFTLIAILFIQNFKKVEHYPYRDSSISKLNSEFKTLPLINIHTTSIRKNAIEPVVEFLINNKRQNSTLLSLGTTNAFNYLTNMQGVFDYPNPSYVDTSFINLKLKEFANNNSKPDFIIYPIVDVTYSDWEVSKVPIHDENGFFMIMDRFILINKYKLSFKNEYFKVYTL